MKNFTEILKENKDICVSLLISVIIAIAIMLVIFEPFNEIPFIYNQF